MPGYIPCISGSLLLLHAAPCLTSGHPLLLYAAPGLISKPRLQYLAVDRYIYYPVFFTSGRPLLDLGKYLYVLGEILISKSIVSAVSRYISSNGPGLHCLSAVIRYSSSNGPGLYCVSAVIR